VMQMKLEQFRRRKCEIRVRENCVIRKRERYKKTCENFKEILLST
jgi:hypothetical protein